MRFSVASGTDNSLLQLIANDTEPYGIGGLLPIQRHFATATGPHALTERLTYTVPADRIARLDFMQLSLLLSTIATVTALPTAEVRIIPSGGAFTILMSARIVSIGVVGDKSDNVSSPKIILEAGDEINIFTSGPAMWFVS